MAAMHLSDRTLLAAADARLHASEPEDRLTEIFREVALTAPSLVAWLVAEAFDLSEADAAAYCSYGDYVVDTQVVLPGGGKPDMAFRFLGDGGSPGRLYCENKIDARWTNWQQLGYPSVESPDRIIVMSPNGRLPDRLPAEQAPKFVAMRWVDLARAANAIGVEWGGRDWAVSAVRPDAHAEYRMLTELISYLEREDIGVTIPRPLTARDIEVLPEVNPVVERWKQARELVVEELRRRERPARDPKKRWDPGAGGPKETLAFSVTLRDGEGWEGSGWPALEALRAPAAPAWTWQELIVSPQARWMGQETPIVAVGIGLERLPKWNEAATDWTRLLEAATDAGAWVGPTDRKRIYRVLPWRPLADFASQGETLDEQVEVAVSWALSELDDLVALRP